MKNWFKSLSKTLKFILVIAPLAVGGGLLVLGVWLNNNIALILVSVICFAVHLFFLTLNGAVETEIKREKTNKKYEEAVSKLPQNVPMKTAEQMYEYTVAHGFGKGVVGWGKKHFKVLEKSLTPDEEAIICFVAQRDEDDRLTGFQAYAITNKRLLIAQQGIPGESVKSVNLDNLNDVTYHTGLYDGYLEFDTFKERVSIAFPFHKEDAMRLYTLINEYFSEFKKNQPAATNNSFSNADELRKFKQLFDDGIITQEEYEEKKRQLLNK